MSTAKITPGSKAFGEALKEARLASPYVSTRTFAEAIDIGMHYLISLEAGRQACSKKLFERVILQGKIPPERIDRLQRLWREVRLRKIGENPRTAFVDWPALMTEMHTELTIALRQCGAGLLQAQERQIISRLEIVLKKYLEEGE